MLFDDAFSEIHSIETEFFISVMQKVQKIS